MKTVLTIGLTAVFVLAAALALAACETTTSATCGTRFECLESVLADPYAAPGAKQLAYEQLLVMWSQATPASDENTPQADPARSPSSRRPWSSQWCPRGDG